MPSAEKAKKIEEEIRKAERDRILKVIDDISDRSWDDDVFKFIALVKEELAKSPG